MALSVSFSDRKFASIPPPDVAFFVESYSHTAGMGPFSARITATGERGELRRLLDMLRYGVDIFDEAGGWRWGGYIHTVQYNLGRVTITSSMDDVANRVKVGYTYQAPNGQQQADQSTVATDQESIDLYGQKEQLFTRTNISYTVAQRIADQALADKRFHKKRLEIGSGVERGKVVLQCRGIGETLGWMNGGELSGAVDNLSDPTGYTAPSNIKQQYLYNHGDNAENTTIQFGDTAAKLYACQGFTVSGSAPVLITDIKVKIVQVGNPADDLLVEIRSGATPWGGILVASGTIKNANIKPAHTWTSVSSITPGFLLPGNTYFITLHRSGAVSGTQYFRWATYSGGGSSDVTTYGTGGAGAVAQGLIAFIDISMETRGRMLTMNALTSSYRIAQSITNISSVPYNLGRVRVRVGRVGTPAGNLFLDVYADSGGQPAAVSLYGVSISGITTEATYTFQIPSVGVGVTQHQPSDRIWLVFATPTHDVNNYYYLLATESGGYTDGNVLTDNGSLWLVPPGELDLYFSAEAIRQTTDQIKDIITSSNPGAGQFMTGCDIEFDSRLFTAVKRDTDISAAKHISNLLNAGASDGTKMLMQVTRERRVRVFKEPTQGSNDYILTSDGRLLTLFDDPDTKARVVAGVWARVNDADVVAAVGAEPALFIDKAEYNALTNTVQYQVRGQINPYDVLGM